MLNMTEKRALTKHHPVPRIACMLLLKRENHDPIAGETFILFVCHWLKFLWLGNKMDNDYRDIK